MDLCVRKIRSHQAAGSSEQRKQMVRLQFFVGAENSSWTNDVQFLFFVAEHKSLYPHR